jgi:adenylosuccinate synthase
LSGVGSAVSRRALRRADVRLARDLTDAWIADLITDVAEECNNALDYGKKVLIEGTQGFGLSLYHSIHYPKTTSRDTSAAGFLSEVGLSPLQVTEIVAVFRTFPIRVSGAQAGPLADEITWETVQREGGYPSDISEFTTVSKALRRVGRFDWDDARATVRHNRPSRIAVMGFDYLDYSDFGKTRLNSVGQKSRDFMTAFESRIGRIDYLGTGPGLENIISRQTGTTIPATKELEVVA